VAHVHPSYNFCRSKPDNALPAHLILYSTSACHLCEEALQIVQPIAKAVNLDLLQVDIAGDESLETLYGLRIPVLVFDKRELGWPFDTPQLLKFLGVQKN
jgi:hypothetical protein